MREEVEKLLRIGHIREIQFLTWISNVVLVPKGGDKWRMCVDFRDLNKPCPRDHYPLPRIDQLVDSTAGCALSSMMDASQGYHQIQLAIEDQPCVSFITHMGTYYYTVMPFGLKNAGATYQRMVDFIFNGQLGRNMEAYVDDMLVKSERIDDNSTDLAESFVTMRRYGMRLNPLKCAFSVKACKFLGYMVTDRGIQVNPARVRALQEMKPPTTLREAQVLAGNVISLSRFISRIAYKSLPFFKVLRKGSSFEWTLECQTAFEQLKEFLATLPLLKQPNAGQPLIVYLAAGEESISAVLVRKEGTEQYPIYFVSRVLQGAEVRYSEVQKVALALVVTARRLKPYFLGHSIIVRTNFPLITTLGKIDVSGRMVKWAVELG